MRFRRTFNIQIYKYIGFNGLSKIINLQMYKKGLKGTLRILMYKFWVKGDTNIFVFKSGVNGPRVLLKFIRNRELGGTRQ